MGELLPYNDYNNVYSTGDIAAYVGLSAAVGLILVVLVVVLTSLFVAKRLQRRRKSFRYQQLNTDAPRNYGSTKCQNEANGFVCSLKPSGTTYINFTRSPVPQTSTSINNILTKCEILSLCGGFNYSDILQ